MLHADVTVSDALTKFDLREPDLFRTILDSHTLGASCLRDMHLCKETLNPGTPRQETRSNDRCRRASQTKRTGMELKPHDEAQRVSWPKKSWMSGILFLYYVEYGLLVRWYCRASQRAHQKIVSRL